jgi:transcriptional regulator EpsA
MRHLDIEANLAGQAQPIVSLVQQAGRIRHHASLVEWLAGPLQAIIPHRAVIAGWGDFDAGLVTYRSMGPAEHRPPDAEMQRLLRGARAHWVAGGMQPQILPGGVFLRGSEQNDSEHALVHGLRDLRVGCDCVYAFLIPADVPVAPLRHAARLLLPSIDLAFRQATAQADDPACGTAGDGTPIAAIETAANDAHEPGPPLSEREDEVMHWVRLGKTNSEIATILNLSTFTVKNHMRRIYKKLNAMNRAQAVSRVGGRTLP